MDTRATIKLHRFHHRGKQQIAISFPYDKKLVTIAKHILAASWSMTNKVWYLEDTDHHLERIFSAFTGEAHIDTSNFKNEPKILPALATSNSARVLTEEQKALLNNFYKYLRGKRYSQSTLDTYIMHMADFLAFHKDKFISELSHREVEEFIEIIYIKRNYSISTQRQFISALKLFIVFESSTQIDHLELKRPSKSKKLPVVLSPNQVIALITNTTNLKHRIIIALLYSAGLRISELIHLEIEHLHIERRQILIKNSKGRKDRYATLAESILPLLQNYLMSYQPLNFLIEGQPGLHYSSSSVRKFLHTSAKKSGIKSRVTPHTLRHSYATHLIENGIGLRYVQELLGHARPETTMIYTHVARKDLLDITSPLDQAVSQLRGTTKGEQKFHISGKY